MQFLQFQIFRNPTEMFSTLNSSFFLHEHYVNNVETSLTGKALDFGSNEYGFESRVSNILKVNLI